MHRLLFLPSHLCDASPCESNNDGHDVDSELKLQKFGDAVIDVATPHHGLHNAGEIIVGQNDVGGLFSHISASNTLNMEQEKTRLLFWTCS